jgi:ribosomal-protein-alanine N-acetyltransferase
MILRFEPLSAHRIPAILEIEREANPAPWSEQSFLNELKNPQSMFLVAIADARLVGYGGYWRCIDEAHITTVAISAMSRRQGLGMRLMKELLLKAREEGMTCSTLEVRASNEAAVRLYERLGYVTAARRKNYYPDNKEDALVMWLYELDKWAPPLATSVEQ